jgi:autotransporter translocation and assembly factor TamB
MRMIRRFLQIVALLSTLAVGAISAIVILTQTAWFRDWLRGVIEREAGDVLNGRLSIGRLDGNLFTGVELQDLQIAMDGEPVIAIAGIEADYNVFTFAGGAIALDSIRVEKPSIRLNRTAEGWNLERLVKARDEEPDSGDGPAVVIRRLVVNGGEVSIDDRAAPLESVDMPMAISAIDAELGLTSTPAELTVDIARVGFQTREPSLAVNELSGKVRRTDEAVALENLVLRTDESRLQVTGTMTGTEDGPTALDVAIGPSTLTVQEIARLVPALRSYALSPDFTASVSGPLDRLQVDITLVDSSLGALTADVEIDTTAPDRRVRGSVSLVHLDLGPVVPGAQSTARGPRPQAGAFRSDITGDAQFDLSLPDDRTPLRGTYAARATLVRAAGYEARNVVARGRIDGRIIGVAAQADAYGSHLSASGTVATEPSLALDLRGRASDVDLRNLPASLRAPQAPTDLNLEYTVSAKGGVYEGTASLDTSTVAGATIAAGTTARVHADGNVVKYAARGSVENLDLQQIGEGFAIQALSTDRYHSRINGSFDVNGEQAGDAPPALDATGTLVDSTVFDAGIPHLDFTTRLSDGDASITAAGEFADLDPSVVAGRERPAGMLTGSIDVQTTLRAYAGGVTADSIDIAGLVTLRGSVDQLTIDSAVVEGQYAGRAGTLTRLEIESSGLKATARGPVSLAERGSTDLVLHAEATSLETIGQIVDQPLKGTAVVDARVTGNATRLEARGTIEGSAIGHGTCEALSLSSEFAVSLPDLATERLAVEATSKVTFLEINGQQITELEAKTSYSDKRLEFTATAQEGVRELEASGAVIFHPDHREIHLPALALRTEKIEWRTPEGVEAAVRHFEDRIEIENLQLTNADQRIAVHGVLGSASEPLDIRVENVDLAEVDRLLLGDERLAGRFAAQAAITGPMKALRAEGRFTVSQGRFRKFTFESLNGQVDYGGRGVMFDARLQATPAEWLAAKGYAPVTLFRPNPEGVGGTHDTPAPGEAIDVEVTSSEIGLGLIQAFTPGVRDVTGVLQAAVRITGSGYDPHFNGQLTIRKGAFTVPELGTSYSGLDTAIGFDDEGITISQFKILDARGFPLTVGGKLAMHARSVGAVDITLESQKFEVIDNKLADLKLNTDLRVTGDLRTPRVEGTVEIENGTVHLTELLEKVTARTYATEAVHVPGLEAAPPAKDEAPTETSADEPSAFDVLDLDIALSVPNNLVLRGSDIRTGQAPVAIGDASITVGGNLQVRKPPSRPVQLVGDINTVRGTYTFQGRRFEILRDGRIGFSGGDEIDPLLDLQARREISGVETFVRVRGTMRRPELSFSSNPPLDEADILALIVFNQPLNELGEGQQVSLASRAAALAGGYVTSGLARSIGSALELDEFEIQAQSDNGGGPGLVVGEQVGRNLFFRVRQAFGSEQTTELILEYQIAEFLRLVATGAHGSAATDRVQFRRVERAGLDLIFVFSY